MKYQLWLFDTPEEFKKDTPTDVVNLGFAPNMFTATSGVGITKTYNKVRDSFIRDKVKGKIVVNYLLHITVNENTTNNKRP